MIDILIEDTKIIAYGIISYISEAGQELIRKYKKPWPTDGQGNLLPKNLCYWDKLGQEVKAKTQSMLQNDITEKTNEELKDICIMLNKVICDCATYDDFKTKIEGIAG